MTGCTDPRLQELLAAWLLGACAPDEDTAIRAHLAACPECPVLLAELRPARDALLRAVPPVEPDPALKGRVMAQVRADASLFAAATERPRAPRPAVRRRWERARVPALAVAAAVGVAAITGVAGGLLEGSGGDARVLTGLVDPAGGERASARLVLDDDRARLEVRGLTRPGAGRAYQVWLSTGDAPPVPTDALFGVGPDGAATVAVPGELEGVDRVLVTSEPAGGSRTPTRAPVLSVRL
jgi:hypothetical protein